MYAISNENSCRPSPRETGRPELPILFHLIDVSRPKRAAPVESESVASARSGETKTVTHLPTGGASLLPPETLLPAVSPPEIKTDVPHGHGAPTEQLATGESLHQDIVKAATSTDELADSPQPTRVTLQEKAADRRKRRTATSEDWFASHGKFIAIGFIVALIGTVYFARTNRQQAEPRKADTSAGPPLADNQAPSATSEPSVAPRVQTVAAVSDSKVELQPPSAPPLISSEAAHDKSSNGDRLFDFAGAKKEEQHVATRPTAAAADASLAPDSANSAKESQKAPSAETPNNSAPILAPAYPVTASPPAGNSTASAAAGYRSDFAAQPPQQPSRQSTWAPPGSPGAPSQYQPYDNTARGPRYERTGSSRY